MRPPNVANAAAYAAEHHGVAPLDETLDYKPLPGVTGAGAGVRARAGPTRSIRLDGRWMGRILYPISC